MKKNLLYKYFSMQLMHWNSANNSRNMPWKGEKDPYKIWLSEIILQQTKVGQGLRFYQNFVKNFSTITDLANASDTKIFKLWEGLGYYTRCKNLIATARYIASEKAGKFPDTYMEILSLKGVGPYTAAAIASFAYNMPYAVLDGNVFRVLARFFGISTAMDSTEGKKEFATLANALLDKKLPGIYNQSIMDFGATICKPKAPLCTTCMLKTKCEAYAKKTTHILPVKEKSIAKKNRQFYYYIATYRNKIYVSKRGKGDIWENLYQFILIERMIKSPDTEILTHLFNENFNTQNFAITKISQQYKQQLTHQTIQASFIHINLYSTLPESVYELIPIKEIKKLPFPKIITAYFEAKNDLAIPEN